MIPLQQPQTGYVIEPGVLIVSGFLFLLLTAVIIYFLWRSYHARQRTNVELTNFNQDITALNDIGKKIISNLSLETIIDTVYENVNSLMDATGFGIGIVDEKKGTIFFPGYIEKGVKTETAEYDLKDKNRLAVKCYTENLEIFMNDFLGEIVKYVDYAQAPKVGEQPQSVIYLPLKSRDKTIGVITVQSFRLNAYTSYDLNLLRNIAVYTTIALENAAIHSNVEEEVKRRTEEVILQKEEIEQSYRNTQVLSDIGQQITSALNFNIILRKIYDNVNKLMPAECFGIRLYHEDINSVEYKFEIEKGEEFDSIMVPMTDDNNYTVWCIKNKKVIFINDNLAEYSKYVKQIRVVSGEMPHSLIFYPLILEEKVIGVITVQSFKKNAYQPHHIDVLKTLGSYAAIALENANLYSSLEQKVEERTTEVVRQTEIIHEKNKEISDSINYARHLQQALLPDIRQLEYKFPESFVLFKPRNIVSGDFYWFSRRGSKFLVAAADCTGHGVPGAFMSMIGIDRLNQSVLDLTLEEPGHILSIVNMGIKDTLKQDEEQSVSRDGMDIALCAIDTNTMTIEYAGANRPLWIMREGRLIEIRPTKAAIGGLTNLTQEFETHKLPIFKGDIIYIHSDGYADQFGGEKGKKMMTKNFKQLLESICAKPMREQMNILGDSLHDWQGNFEQVDDILVIGIRV